MKMDSTFLISGSPLRLLGGLGHWGSVVDIDNDDGTRKAEIERQRGRDGATQDAGSGGASSAPRPLLRDASTLWIGSVGRWESRILHWRALQKRTWVLRRLEGIKHDFRGLNSLLEADRWNGSSFFYDGKDSRTTTTQSEALNAMPSAQLCHWVGKDAMYYKTINIF